jgi:hypothetical protein
MKKYAVQRTWYVETDLEDAGDVAAMIGALDAGGTLQNTKAIRYSTVAQPLPDDATVHDFLLSAEARAEVNAPLA